MGKKEKEPCRNRVTLLQMERMMGEFEYRIKVLTYFYDFVILSFGLSSICQTYMIRKKSIQIVALISKYSCI